MGDDTFNDKLLTDKLSKLNSSQQSIESVSKWCISHRKKAKQVVETWEKLFKSAQSQQQVSFLYLSNDILQNSRRKGNEYVNEFWKVLPAALKGVYDGGNENCRKVALRLVDIFEERKVFGSRGQNLKSEVLGENPSPANIVKSSNPIKVVKRDATSLRVKLAVGGLPEKILTAMQLVQDEVANEETALIKCHDAVSCVREIEKDAVNASRQGNMQAEVIYNIEKQENMIQQCISELEKSEEIRVALVCQLKEALQDQESKLEQIRSELLVARGQIQQAANIRLRLTSGPPLINQPAGNPSPPPPPPATTHSPFSASADEDSKRSAAAAVAAKLAASTSSAQMLTSILSSLVAEEAASVNVGLKRPRLEPEGPPGPSPYFTSMPPGTMMMQAVSQVQTQPFMPPPQPPAPPLVPFSYGPGSFALAPGPLGQLSQPVGPQQGQPPASGGYFRPVGAGFYGQPPTTPPVHRQ
ncbi:regulation of nuclear pre-mRNA domain-containing protein 1B [Striga asiatica]|uniref:Regulation of nuclear pre-mRNA domain-containing protein 1B n=1 Tax=Striga asiatica TaxID=4170 RepID=A0A5A7P050_STRAF|nr:regulation of nuclear pre-mRNA domain-containing protein 1B [Striga asiatica]